MAGTRIVTWNGWTSGTLNYREYIRIGSGAPAGILTVAPLLVPGTIARAAVGAAVLRAGSKGHLQR
jgi:hypothetical protein